MGGKTRQDQHHMEERFTGKRKKDNENVYQNTSELLPEIIEQNKAAIECFERGETSKALCVFQELAQRWSAFTCGLRCTPKEDFTVQDTLPRDRTKKEPAAYEYDEGLDFFCDPEEILDDASHPELVSATLLFNAGLTAKRKIGIDVAAIFYQSALDLMLPNLCRSQEKTTFTVHLVRILVPTLHNMARLKYLSGDIEGAKAFYELALQEGRKIEGPRSSSVGASLNCLGVLLHKSSFIGDIEQSLKCLKESLEVYSLLFGSESTQVATVLNNIGRVHLKLGDVKISLDCFDKARLLRKKLLGANHPDYGAAAFNTAQNLFHLENHGEALPHYLEYLAVAESSQTESNSELVTGLCCIAEIYQKTGDHKKALKYFKRSIQMGKKFAETLPMEYSKVLNKVGNFHSQVGSFREALEAYDECLQIEQAHLEADHPYITRTLSNIAETYRRMGKLAKSIELYKKAAVLLRERNGPESPQVAAALNVVGLVQDQNGDVFSAIETLQEALVLRKFALGECHLDVSATMLYLGTIYCKTKMAREALQMFQGSYKICHSVLGRNDVSVSRAAYNIGICHQATGQWNAGIIFFREALDIQKRLPGDHEATIALSAFKIGQSFYEEGMLHEALAYLEEARGILQNKIPTKHDSAILVKTLEYLSGLYSILSKKDDMMEALVQSARILRENFSLSNALDVSLALRAYEYHSSPCASSA